MAKGMEQAERLRDELARAYGDDLVSVVLYGSAARGDFQPGVSDLNVLVLLRRADAAALRRGTEVAKRWAAQGNPPPLLLGAEEWRRSADVFPIEVSDIREAHRVLHGPDPFEGVSVDREHLRLQCENELKGKQIRLRERYLLLAGSPRELGEMLTASLSTFLALFRAVLRLAGEEAPRDPEATVRAVGALTGMPPEPVLALLRARGGSVRYRPAADAPEVVGYLEGVDRVVRWVDRLATHEER